MSWTTFLCKTYELNAGKTFDDGNNIVPVAHKNENAQLEVTIDREGEFIRAAVVNKEDAVTVIPVTESSAGRSSGTAPHALNDNLSYVAGDLYKFVNSADKAGEKLIKTNQKRYEAYIRALEKWDVSEWTHPKVHAVLVYLLKRRLAEDLIHEGILHLGEDGFFKEEKIVGQTYDKATVRFRVLDPSGEYDDTWKDSSLIKAYIRYYASLQGTEMDICYMAGEKAVISSNHPKGIVASNYNAKLVSANDERGFTYRGRFNNAGEAYALSYEASQQMHSALSWLIKTRGTAIGVKSKRIFICWNPEAKELPDFLNGILPDDALDDEQNYREMLYKTLHGYENKFSPLDPVIVMSLDAATTGRLSVTYYYEIGAGPFFQRIRTWYENCSWLYPDYSKGTFRTVEKSPSFQKIIQYAYGVQRDKFLEVDDRILKPQVQRLVKCMLEGDRIPADLVQTLTARASNRMAFNSHTAWEGALSTACAVISMMQYQKRGGERTDSRMTLDLECKDRSYLFGRLLAVCEQVEHDDLRTRDDRETNAIRLQQSFVNHPMKTWMILEGLINPYYQRLSPGKRQYYKRIVSEIVSMLQETDSSKLNRSLNENYLLGYYLQRAALRTKKVTESTEEE